MSGGLDVLSLREDDVKKFLVCGTHLGATNMDFQMEQYLYKRKTDGMLCMKSISAGHCACKLGTDLQNSGQFEACLKQVD